MKPWRQCGLLLLAAVIPALLTGWLHPRRPEWSWQKPAVIQVSLDEVARWQGAVLWVDARETRAYEQRHVPGAVSLNETEWNRLLPGFLEAWQPSAHIVVYCNSEQCDASQAVALRLKRELDLPEIHVLKGGWSAWQQAHP